MLETILMPMIEATTAMMKASQQQQHGRLTMKATCLICVGGVSFGAGSLWSRPKATTMCMCLDYGCALSAAAARHAARAATTRTFSAAEELLENITNGCELRMEHHELRVQHHEEY